MSQLFNRISGIVTREGISIVLLLISLTLSLWGQEDTQATAAEYTQEQRLKRLVDILERKRREYHIPGMAIAVVKDSEVIFLHGFGWADIEKKTPVTPATIFGLGSATKSFGSALIAMLVDEGKMHWDDPIIRHLPYFQLHPKGESGSQVTLRDVLCHRTGYMRMNIVWLNPTVSSRKEVLKRMMQAEPFSKFRQRFNYTNVGYLAAGEASASAGGKAWDTLVAERIFQPLGMTASNTSIRDSAEDPRTATGYIWEQYARQNKALPLRNMDLSGAAGCINSNVEDMAKWLLFHLNKGTFQGKRLLSETNHQEMWNPQFPLGKNRDYGLGWFIREWKGRLQVDHGGGITGFNAQVAMLPELQLGFVLLSNRQTNPLIDESFDLVWGTLLGEKPMLPTAEEVLRLRRSKETHTIIANMKTFRITGRVKRHQSGAGGNFTWTASGNDRYLQDQDYGDLGYIRQAHAPEIASLSNTIFPYQKLRGRFYEQSALQHPAAIFGDWNGFYDVITVTGEGEERGRKVYKLRLRRELVPPYTATVDAETGDLLRLDTRWLRPGSSSSMPEIFTFEDYREHRGLRIPYTISSLSPYHGLTVYLLEEIETNLDLADSVFRITPEKEK
jgi:CubicO group peptidase (beta-lactamase class C family)